MAVTPYAVIERLAMRIPSRPSWLFHVAIAVLVTFPVVTSPWARPGGHPDGDLWNHAWGAWWWWQCLVHGQLPWRTDLLGAPTGGVLWYIDPLGALATAPLVPLVGVVGAWNLLLLLASAFNSFAGRRLARALGASREASWIGAVGAAAAPAVLCEIHNGISEAATLGGGLLALAEGTRLFRHSTDGDAGAGGAHGGAWWRTGAWLGITFAGSVYQGLAAALVLTGWALAVTLRPEPGDPPRAELARRISGAIGVGLGIALPVLVAVHASIRAPDALVRREHLAVEDAAFLDAHNAVDPRAFLVPGGFQSVDLGAMGESFLHSSYVGGLALLLACCACRGRWLAGLLPAGLFALGPALWWSGDWVYTPDGGRVPLPFAVVRAVLPDLQIVHPQRLGSLACVVVPCIAACGADRVVAWIARARAGTRVAGLGILTLGVLVDALAASPWPLARGPELDTRAHVGLADVPAPPRSPGRHRTQVAPPRAVLDLPSEVGETMRTSRYLLYQAASGLPTPYVPDARAGTTRVTGLPAFAALTSPFVTRDATRRRLDEVLARASSLDPAELPTAAGIRWVIVHRELMPGDDELRATERLLTGWYGAPSVLGTHARWDTLQAGRGRGATRRTW